MLCKSWLEAKSVVLHFCFVYFAWEQLHAMFVFVFSMRVTSVLDMYSFAHQRNIKISGSWIFLFYHLLSFITAFITSFITIRNLGIFITIYSIYYIWCFHLLPFILFIPIVTGAAYVWNTTMNYLWPGEGWRADPGKQSPGKAGMSKVKGVVSSQPGYGLDSAKTSHIQNPVPVCIVLPKRQR